MTTAIGASFGTVIVEDDEAAVAFVSGEALIQVEIETVSDDCNDPHWKEERERECW